MFTLFRWLLRAVTGLVVIGVLAGLLFYWFLSRSLIDYSEDFTLPGISAPVEIVRNNDSVPHIFGATDADVFFALGFVHAQDRLWQMTMLRRTAQGRLSEMFGKKTLPVDELMRRLDLYGLALDSVAAQDPQTLAALKAYSAGVNSWIDQINQGARGRGAPEFWLFSTEISAWAPADSIAILKLMALQLSDQASAEVLRARLSLVLPADRLADILPEDPGKGVAALPDYASLVPGAVPGVQLADADVPLLPLPAPG
ncbi:MAG: penicillin acylase family protein, partial [Paracoccaceae bacterium]